jgi:RNase H.
MGKIIPYFEDDRFTWHKVKGHAGVDMNEMVDSMVQSAAEKLKGELNA